MTFNEAMDYINSVSKKGSVLGLDTTRELLARVGNPQDKLKLVHIAGTNGKGSVLAFVSNVLASAGLRTGRYISPVIYCYNEKIQINGENISNEAVAALVEVVKAAAEAMVADGFEQPTVFEIETVMSFLYFLNEGCDIVVLETGMGGRDDSTNVIGAPVCAILTSISLDHVGILGNNLEEIAQCKAGIIKNGSKVVLYNQSQQVMDIVSNVCREKNCQLTVTRPELVNRISNDLSGQVFNYGDLTDIHISLLGEHQVNNAITALETIFALRESGFDIDDEAIKKGMSLTRWPGRFEIVNNRPLIIMDGAHNPDGARTFAKAVDEYLDGYIRIFVMGVLRDKDYKEIISLTNNLASAIITVDPDNARALSDVELKDAINEIKTRDIPVLSAGRIEAGIELATQLAIQLNHEKTAIVVFGSLSFLGDLGRYLYQL